ncbi:MAG: zinc protease [Rhodobacteraceae bacterium HLUCCA12]|nr:MAG: zinc protease [Rhodobacteraceae bacterium HLUCCA12]
MRLLTRVVPALALAMIAALPLWAEEPQQFSLDNGMDVIVIEDHRVPVVTHMVWYRVGAADEPPGQSGIAHYLEHLMFKATDTMEAGEFSAVVEANGGRDNAFTSWDYTAYHQRVAADRLDLMMEMEADRMVNLRLDRSDWEPERSVILEERGQSLESRPEGVFNEQMRAALFQNHPYGIPIIGWRHEMEQLDDTIAEDFYRKHYAPNNAVLVVAGDVDADEVRDLAERHYGAIPANPDLDERVRPLEPTQQAERRLILRDGRVGQPYVNRMYLAPNRRPGDQREAAAYQVLAALLGGSAQTSVLERRLTYDEGVALSAWAGYSGTALDHGVFVLGIAPAQDVGMQEAEDALDDAFAEFLETGVDMDQLERVRMQLRAAEIYERDDVAARARTIGADLATGLTLADSEAWIEVLQDITPDEILAAARDLDRRASVTGWLMGEDD